MGTAEPTSDAWSPGLPNATRMGRVRLRVRDLPRMLAFYEGVLGYAVTRRDGGTATLAPAGTREPHVVLREDRALRPRPRRTAGLYHAAILMPTRRDLAAALVRLANAGWPILGASDHGVSEALYLDDPEGNGLELYADRPRERWPLRDGELGMTTLPLDIESLLGELADGRPVEQAMPAGSAIGHVHLQVSDLGRAERFYVEALGFSVMQRSYAGALFVSAGGYHHHLGLNVWAGQGIPPAPADAAGLAAFAVVLPDRASWDAARARLEAAGVAAVEQLRDGPAEGILVRDPDGIGLEVWAAT